jgi:hypothetical protein
VSVDRCIARRAREILALSERNVLIVGVLVALGQTEVDNVYVILCTFSSADQEVVGFDVAMNYSFLVNFLDALDLSNE